MYVPASEDDPFFAAEDNYFWLEPGETVSVKINMDASGISAWNAE